MTQSISNMRKQKAKTAWLFLLPSLVILSSVALWPLLRTMYFSLTDAVLTLSRDYVFVGMENYVTLLEDSLWWTSVQNTLTFTAVSVSIETVLGLTIALLLGSSLRGRGMMRAIILIPWSIPVVVSARMWQWMLHDQFGVINHILSGLGLIEQGIAWTAKPELALPVIIVVDVWITTPFMVLLILAGVSMLPKNLYEVAAIDGIPAWKQFVSITLPLLAPSIAVAVLFRMLDALRIFDLAYILSANSDNSKTITIYAREILVNFQEMGLGSAASTLVFFILAGVTLLYLAAFRINLTNRKA